MLYVNTAFCLDFLSFADMSIFPILVNTGTCVPALIISFYQICLSLVFHWLCFIDLLLVLSLKNTASFFF